MCRCYNMTVQQAKPPGYKSVSTTFISYHEIYHDAVVANTKCDVMKDLTISSRVLFIARPIMTIGQMNTNEFFFPSGHVIE
jgi:hypothetical protein